MFDFLARQQAGALGDRLDGLDEPVAGLAYAEREAALLQRCGRRVEIDCKMRLRASLGRCEQRVGTKRGDITRLKLEFELDFRRGT
jgi:hypothetical protein